MRPAVSVQRLHGLPPVVVIDLSAGKVGRESPAARAKEILIVQQEPTLRQALGLFVNSLGILLRCGCRSCRHYGATVNRGHAYAIRWYTRDASQ